MGLEYLDAQLEEARHASDVPRLSSDIWPRIASQIYDEVRALDEMSVNRLRVAVVIPPERYREELWAFQQWVEHARCHAHNPAVVRAQVMTELYVAFVWLRDSLLKPTKEVMPAGSTFEAIETFLRGGNRRLLRNAVAHGRWTYLPDFSGIEYWAEPMRGRPLARYMVRQEELGAWQLLSRGPAIAVLLALTDEH